MEKQDNIPQSQPFSHRGEVNIMRVFIHLVHPLNAWTLFV